MLDTLQNVMYNKVNQEKWVTTFSLKQNFTKCKGEYI